MVKSMKFLPIILCGVLASQIGYAKENPANNRFKQVFHNRACMGGSCPGYERARLEFYFERNPLVDEPVRECKGTACTETYFIRNVTVADGHKLKKQLTVQANDAYQVSASYKNGGMRIVFAYDPEKIMIQYQTISSIGLEEGLVFFVRDKEAWEQVKKAQENERLLRFT